MGRKLNTFTVDEALKLFARAGNDDQRRESLDRLTLARLRELAKERGIALEFNIKKEFVINLIMKELSQRHETEPVEPEAREPEEQRQEVRETAAERKARLEREMREREAAAAAVKPEVQVKGCPFNQLRRRAGLTQQEVARAIRCNLDDYLNVEYWGRGKGSSRQIASKARKYLVDCIRLGYT
ncbi:MAG: hypothetical protein IJ576_00840 [Synergistaceae bacterium]|nr:hypothetical protein [Synergistaceae bacterium]MBR1602962.1 hypothetical protein [Synergistaceae bacterium]